MGTAPGAIVLETPVLRLRELTESDAARAVLAHATGALGIRRVVAVIAPENVGSIRVAERLGMRHEGNVPYKTFGVVRM